MDTPIGRAFDEEPRHLRTATVAAAVLVACDLLLVWRGEPLLAPLHLSMTHCRFVFLVIAITLYGRLTASDPDSLGLNLRPVQGYFYWVWGGLFIGASVLLFIALALGVYKVLGIPLGPLPKLAPSKAGPWFYFACINAPLLEEVIYRFILCVPLARAAKPSGAIFISGALFALLHFAYGNPSPDNFIAGYFLAWAYLKSGSLLVPVVFHAIGNLAVLLFQLGVWHYTTNS